MAGHIDAGPATTRPCHHQEMTDYRDAVRPATEAIDVLSSEIEADLDEMAGGISWWNGHVGWKVSAQLGEYLLASCTGVGTSLRNASLAVEEHRRTEFSLNHKRSARARSLFGRVSSRDEKIAVFMPASAAEERNENLQAIWAEQVLVSLAQALDRLAAVVLVVSGVKANVLGTDWNELMKIAEKEPRSGQTQGVRQGTFAASGTTGRDRQSELLQIAVAWNEHGPEDWLPWLLKARNGTVHRASRMRFHVMTTDKGQPSGLITPLYAQPDWADTEAVISASRGGLESMFLSSTPQAVFEGLLTSVASLSKAVVDASRQLWIDRRANPELIIQHGGTWRHLGKASVYQFPGYGDAAPTLASEIAVHPSAIRRLRAAKLMDDQVGKWRSSSSDT